MSDGRKRVVIENVRPQVDEGRFPVKRVLGESVAVRADVFADGHDTLRSVLLYRSKSEEEYRQVAMRHLGNDLWSASFRVEAQEPYLYTVLAWVDHFRTWRKDLAAKAEAGQDVSVELLDGARMVVEAAERAKGEDAAALHSHAQVMSGPGGQADRVALAVSQELLELMDAHPDTSLAVRFPRELKVWVDPPRALFSAWYEVFPRSTGRGASHGTFKDLEGWLPEIARMGFDVLYLPPIHPIGTTHRKGRNNTPEAGPEDPGSPWAIGSPQGGHEAIHPELGSLEDFQHLVREAGELGMKVALDMAFQCSPDHPWVQEHPEWFTKRADGSIQYAENPPKKYQDIFPLNFESTEWRSLWEELLGVFLFWAGQGVRIFRVDNPHTKPHRFWEWVIAAVKKEYPEAVFLAEAFTRPKVMYRLAKAGFTQSYTYFTWRNTKVELVSYMTELVDNAPRDFFRPNFWPNTPDILPEYLQYGGRPAFMTRLLLAATLSSSYGIYGPAFELCENQALPDREEYAHSEKYEIKDWDWDRPGNLKDFITTVNRIRRDNPALQSTWNLRFLEAENEAVLFYLKSDPDLENIILVAVNLDPHHKQSAWVHVPVRELGIPAGTPYLAHDLIGDDKFIWTGERNFIELDPFVVPGRIFRLRRRLKRETDFDYFM